jgi:8-oxo-dGTP pyrophosphatase MutT (NUDIX family)
VGRSPHRVILDVHLLLVRDGHVLLSQRRGGYGDGMWHLPSGKAEAGESIEDAVIREAFEEVGVTVRPADLRCVHAVQVQHTGEEPRVGFFFEATRWHGEPSNRAAGISGYLRGIAFSLFEPGQDSPRPISPPVQPLPSSLATLSL